MTLTREALPPAVLVWSGKGGVGKSTIAASLAAALHNRGRRVGYLDADFHGPSAPVLFNVDSRMRVRAGRIVPVDVGGLRVVSSGFLAGPTHPHVWHGMLLQGAMNQLCYDTDWGDADILLVDLPPGTGEIQIGLLARLAVGAVVIVTTPHEVAYADVLRSARMLSDAGLSVTAIVENMSRIFCPSCAHGFRPFAGQAGPDLAQRYPDAALITLPLDAEATAPFDAGAPGSAFRSSLAGLADSVLTGLAVPR